MMWLFIILMVIVGISFIVWYSHQQESIHDAPVRPFLKGVSKYRDVGWVLENCPNALPSLYLSGGWYSFNNKFIFVRMISLVHREEYEYTVLKMGEIFKRVDYCSLWILKNHYGQTVLGSDKLIEFMDKYPEKQCTPCEDPHKTHWEYFLKLEMLAKKQREVDCHKYVDDILQKQITYNDLNLQYQMLPSAPITDVESFRNFCKVVHEDTKYEDYEIQNYLLLKKSMQ